MTMVVRSDTLKSTLSAFRIDRIYSTPNVQVLTNTAVTAVNGEECLKSITITNRKTGESKTVETRWLFVCIGGRPHTDWAVEAGVSRDEAGYLITEPDLQVDGKPHAKGPLDRNPYYLETNIPGLFAAGDVRHNSIKRCACAVGEGAMAVAFAHRYLSSG